MEQVIARCAEILKEGGALYVYLIPKWAVRLSPYLEEHLQFRHRIAITVNNGFVWHDFSPVRHRKSKSRVANELPLVFPRRVVTISGNNRAFLVDPFAGSGSPL